MSREYNSEGRDEEQRQMYRRWRADADELERSGHLVDAATLRVFIAACEHADAA